jgi:lysozyme
VGHILDARLLNRKACNQTFGRLTSGVSLLFTLAALSACTSSGTQAIEVTGSIPPSPPAAVGQVQPVVQAQAVQANAPLQEYADAPASPEPIQTQTEVASLDPQSYRPTTIERPAKLHPRFGDYKPFDFPGRQPTDYAVHGTDTSRWQPEIAWNKVQNSGISFAFIKATEGGDVLDKSFKENFAKAKAAGVPRGAYHFYYFCTAPEAQARWYLKHLPRDAGAMPPVLDAEWNHASRTCRGKPSPAKVRNDLAVWLNIVQKATGKRPIIYTTPDFYDDNDMGRFENDFWLRSTAAHPSERYPNEKWTFWQYTGTGKIPGIEGKADINVFRGSEADWRKWLAKHKVTG